LRHIQKKELYLEVLTNQWLRVNDKHRKIRLFKDIRRFIQEQGALAEGYRRRKLLLENFEIWRGKHSDRKKREEILQIIYFSKKNNYFLKLKSYAMESVQKRMDNLKALKFYRERSTENYFYLL
jgi:hypothetical protein